ncbi:hypothetical protein MHK_000833 [Candidatus Magnetomorum sp. HK-1]|nr:hypothetical protein MHK_000833 [Candidatus Magnetomorum sp. HK-1]
MSATHSEKFTFAGFIAEALHTKEIGNSIDAVLTEIINKWEKGNAAKSVISNPVKWFVKVSFSKPEDTIKKNELLTLIISKSIPMVRAFFENTDFSDIKTFLEQSKDDFKKIIQGINTLLVEYPGKLITSLSFIPDISNHLIFYLKDLISRLNALPADILTDILLSVLKEIDPKTTARLINNFNELVRQVHTGSALIGEAGSPQFSADLIAKLRIILNEIDPELLLKAGNAIIDGKKTVISTFNNVISEDQTFLKIHLEHLMSSQNAKTEVLKEKLEKIEDLNDEEGIKELISVLNTYDLAEIINIFFRILNELHEDSPELFQNLISEFFNTLDINEIQETFIAIFYDTGSAFRPFLRTIVPVFVKEFINCMTPEDDGNDEKIAEMQEMLRHFIMGKEI